ncbi:MAG TPA: hypothetical protein VLA51_07270 [Paracoccaceae bacterium]|nr:hypothetical protein [Paracoccaceae bacterium]
MSTIATTPSIFQIIKEIFSVRIERTQPAAKADFVDEESDRRDFILDRLYENSDAFASEADVSSMMSVFADRF